MKNLIIFCFLVSIFTFLVSYNDILFKRKLITNPQQKQIENYEIKQIVIYQNEKTLNVKPNFLILNGEITELIPPRYCENHDCLGNIFILCDSMSCKELKETIKYININKPIIKLIK